MIQDLRAKGNQWHPRYRFINVAACLLERWDTNTSIRFIFHVAMPMLDLLRDRTARWNKNNCNNRGKYAGIPSHCFLVEILGTQRKGSIGCFVCNIFLYFLSFGLDSTILLTKILLINSYFLLWNNIIIIILMNLILFMLSFHLHISLALTISKSTQNQKRISDAVHGANLQTPAGSGDFGKEQQRRASRDWL